MQLTFIERFSLLRVSMGESPEAPAILRYLRPENSWFWAVVYQASTQKYANGHFERYNETPSIIREIFI